MSLRRLPELSLSLQYGAFEDRALLARHRQALARHRVTQWIRHALPCPAILTVRIVDTEEARSLNATYRARDYATNVLTFDYSRPPQSTEAHADLVLCAPVVEQEARDQGKTLQAHYAHMIVHGTLHACGYDHETNEKDALVMEAIEIMVLDMLGVANPY